MGCISEKCAKRYLYAINIIVLIIGIAGLVTGLVLLLNNDAFKTDEVRILLNQVKVTGTIDLGDLLFGLSIGIIFLGVFTAGIAALGFCGTRRRNECCLLVYGGIVLVLVFAQLVLIILWGIMKGKITDDVHKQLSKTLEDYDGVDSTNDVSNGWDFAFIGYECCGVNKVTEIENEFTTSKWWPKRLNTSDIAPASCCKGATKDNYRNQDPACQQSLTAIYDQGCYDSFRSWLEGFITAFLTGLAFLFFFEVFAIICTCKVFKETKDRNGGNNNMPMHSSGSLPNKH